MLKFATKFLPCAEAFETAFRAGYRNAEFWLDASVLSGWQSIAAMARQHAFLWKYTLQDCSLDELLSVIRGFLTKYGDKLHHIHLPGYQVGGEEHRPLHHSPQMAAGVLSLLADFGFPKLVVSEARTAYQNLDDLRRDVRLFEDWSARFRAAA